EYGPTDSEKNDVAFAAKIMKTLVEFVQISRPRTIARIIRLRSRPSDCDFAFPYGEVTQKRNEVRCRVDEKDAAEMDVLVDESNQSSRDHPAALDAGKQQRIRADEFRFGSQLLNERGDGRPEHPEGGGDHRAHRVQIPNPHVTGYRKHGD